jgi:hypothetical protein
MGSYTSRYIIHAERSTKGEYQVAVKLITTISKIPNVPNFTNSVLIKDFYQYMVENEPSERNQNNYLKVIIPFAMFLSPDITFYEIKRKEQIAQFLDTNTRSQEEDPDGKWITTCRWWENSY